MIIHHCSRVLRALTFCFACGYSVLWLSEKHRRNFADYCLASSSSSLLDSGHLWVRKYFCILGEYFSCSWSADAKRSQSSKLYIRVLLHRVFLWNTVQRQRKLRKLIAWLTLNVCTILQSSAGMKLTKNSPEKRPHCQLSEVPLALYWEFTLRCDALSMCNGLVVLWSVSKNDKIRSRFFMKVFADRNPWVNSILSYLFRIRSITNSLRSVYSYSNPIVIKTASPRNLNRFAYMLSVLSSFLKFE